MVYYTYIIIESEFRRLPKEGRVPRMAIGRKRENDGALAPYYFHQGTTTYAYAYMGAHSAEGENRGERVWTFRVWAPNAESVSLVGDFCGWSEGLPMKKTGDAGDWEITLTAQSDWTGMRYKYKIIGANGTHLKADPYGVYSECLSHTASILYELQPYPWHDRGWKIHRKKKFSRKQGEPYCSSPLNIYEMHLGSFRTRNGATTHDNADAYLNYREIADMLVPYLKEMGYTHVELLPVMEHPYDGSWGYQVCSYYAPTSRFGSPEDFMYFVDTLHASGIGVILDWVPAHFPKDEHGLYEFDGQPLYEYQGRDRMEHEGWGTRCFDVGRNEIQSFLISDALFWLREYHIDGLRMDAVAAMLYLDFDKRPGEWFPNPDGSNKNQEAVAFFKKLNGCIEGEFPDVLLIAEESSDWEDLTKPTWDGGLGFTFKWNMGWANDLFDYVETDPFFRKYKHDKLTFPLMYAFKENYILPVSHDEVVHGKKSLLDKMFGTYEQKFAGFRAFLAYMMTQPGKKLTFMGTEYAPFREWDYENQLEWFMLDYDMHKKTQQFTAALNNFYLSRRELWEDDQSWGGYRWLSGDEADTNTISYARFDRNGAPLLIAVNFAPVTREEYIIPLTREMPRAYREAFSTDAAKWGGSDARNPGVLKAEPYIPHGARDTCYRLKITLPGLSAVVLMPDKTNRNK